MREKKRKRATHAYFAMRRKDPGLNLKKGHEERFLRGGARAERPSENYHCNTSLGVFGELVKESGINPNTGGKKATFSE